MKGHLLVTPGEPANSLKPPMIGQMPNGLEMKKMHASRGSFASGSRAGNKVVPVVPEIEVEVCCISIFPFSFFVTNLYHNLFF
jgi:hypothetical protein